MNVVDGLNNIIKSNNMIASQIREDLAKKYGFKSDEQELVFFHLINHLQDYKYLIYHVSKSFGWDFSFETPSLLTDYYTLAYENLSKTINNISKIYGFKDGEIEAESYWIPDDFIGEKATTDDTIGEWHFTVSYKDTFLFGFVFTPLEDDYAALVSEDVEESFNCETFGYEANPYIFLNNYDDVERFLHTYFENANIKGFDKIEKDRKTNKI